MAEATTQRRRHTPLRPMTPFGLDLPEDMPSKIRLRSAVHCARVRRLQETESRKAELQVGHDLHKKVTEERARKAEQAKADATLRRQLFAKNREHKLAVRQLEAARERELLAKENAKKLAERRRQLHEDKLKTRKELAERKADVIEAREQRARDRALAAVTRRAEAARIADMARAAEEDRRKENYARKQSLRARADCYRENKELRKTAAFAR